MIPKMPSHEMFRRMRTGNCLQSSSAFPLLLWSSQRIKQTPREKCKTILKQRGGLPRLSCSGFCFKNSSSSFHAFSNPPRSRHGLSQHIMSSILKTVSLLSSFFVLFHLDSLTCAISSLGIRSRFDGLEAVLLSRPRGWLHCGF